MKNNRSASREEAKRRRRAERRRQLEHDLQQFGDPGDLARKTARNGRHVPSPAPADAAGAPDAVRDPEERPATARATVRPAQPPPADAAWRRAWDTDPTDAVAVAFAGPVLDRAVRRLREFARQFDDLRRTFTQEAGELAAAGDWLGAAALAQKAASVNGFALGCRAALLSLQADEDAPREVADLLARVDHRDVLEALLLKSGLELPSDAD